MTLQNIFPTHPFSGFAAAVHNLRARAAEWRETHAIYTQTLNELSALSDHELADIGFHRSEIPRIAADAAKMK